MGFSYNTVSTASTIPTGAIIAYSGLIADIPAGWHLCDGNSGTVDLRDKFIVGALADGIADNDPDGTQTLSTVDDSSGNHHGGQNFTITSLQSGVVNNTYQPGSAFSGSGAAYSSSLANINTANFYIVPPFIALAYIQKV